MRTRRLFWLGAAILLSAAAVVAIAAVLTGEFGETQSRILGTVGLLFACGSTALAGRACIERRVVVPAAYAAIALAAVSFVYWTVGIWATYESQTLGKIAGILAEWFVALLIVTTLRLLLRVERLRPVFIGTVATATLAALVGTVMIARDSSTGWQALLVLVILTVAGYFLVPILQRFTAAGAAERPRERVLSVVGGVEVVAVRGGPRAVRVGGETFALDEDETVVVRPHE